MKEAAWTLSNITAGTVLQIDRVLEMDLMADVINVLSHGDFKAKKEATWAVTNLTSGGKPHQMKAIIELGVLEPLARMLTCNDIKIVQVRNKLCDMVFIRSGHSRRCHKHVEHGRRNGLH